MNYPLFTSKDLLNFANPPLPQTSPTMSDIPPPPPYAPEDDEFASDSEEDSDSEPSMKKNDNDNDNDSPIPIKLRIEATHTVHGNGNMVPLSPAQVCDAQRLGVLMQQAAHIVHQVTVANNEHAFAVSGQGHCNNNNNGNNQHQANASANANTNGNANLMNLTARRQTRPRSVHIDLTINCGINVVGDRNTLAPMAIRQPVATPWMPQLPQQTVPAAHINSAHAANIANTRAAAAAVAAAAPMPRGAAVNTNFVRPGPHATAPTGAMPPPPIPTRTLAEQAAAVQRAKRVAEEQARGKPGKIAKLGPKTPPPST